MKGKEIEVHADVCIKSPALRRTMHRLVGNITAGVAQVVAQEVGIFLEALEQTFEESTVGGASHE